MIKRGSSSSAQRRHRLPEQSRVPNETELQYLYGLASKQPGHLMELPWSLDRQQYVLTAKLERRSGEQSYQWSFYRGDGPNSKLEWSYETSDIVMIHSLIMTAFPPDPIVADPALLASLQPVPEEQQPPAGNNGPSAFAPPAAPAAPAVPDVKGVLEGSLADMPLSSLLTSVQSSRLTGKLSIKNPSNEMSELSFEEGLIVDARKGNLDGEEAFMDLMINCPDGEFKFIKSAEKIQNKTIKLPHEALVLKAAALTDQATFLDRQGLKADSCLMRTNPNITEKEFEEKLHNMVPVDMSLQKRMYQAVDNKTLFSELLTQCALPRTAWTPLIFNLLSSGLVSLGNQAPIQPVQQQQPLDQSGSNPTIDLAALEKFTASMARRDTGVYTEIAFLFFLEHEFYRFHSYETPFTLALFKFTNAQGNVSKETMKKALDIVKTTVRKADILGHYEGDDFAIILPHTEPRAALGLVTRLKTLLHEPPFHPNEVALSMGMAGIPEDCQDLMSLLKIARLRKNTSGQV